MPHTYTTYSLGNSYQNRPVIIHVFKADNEQFRVLYVCGQHGIEGETPQGADLLITDIRTTNPTYYDNVTVAVLPRLNPDGLANETYNNAQGWAIGVDSLYMASTEARLLYAFVRQFKPNVFVDGHNLDAWNRGRGNYLYDHHLQYNVDTVIQIDDTQNPRHKLTWKQYDDVINYLNTNFTPYKYDRFWSFTDELVVVYDTPDPVRLHHFIPDRYDAIGFLVEGISPYETDPDDNREERAIQSTFRFFKGLIGWCKLHPEVFAAQKNCPYVQGTEFPVRWDYIWEKEQFETRNLFNDQTGQTGVRLISTAYRYLYEPTQYVTIPLGYAWPNTDDFATLNWWMGQYGYTHTVGQATDSYEIETIAIHSATTHAPYTGTDYLWNRAPTDVVTSQVRSTMTNFSGWVVALTNQLGGHFLCSLLEPKSQYALTRYLEESNLRVIPNTDYVVKRLIRRIA